MATVTYAKATRIYPGSTKPAVDALDLQIADGEFLVLVGPSGCGKSTSLRMLAGLEEIDSGAVYIDETDVTNVPPASRQPYVGVSAFAHKAGLHASAIKVDPDLYQHMKPEGVGNDMRLLVSDMAGRASIELKGRELGFDLSGDKDLVDRVTARVKEMESRGYTFEAADASFELLLLEELEGARPSYVEVESWRVITETRPGAEAVSEATVKLRAGGARIVQTGEGNGPVNALDQALREAIGQAFPEVTKFELIDYKVRISDQGHGTDAITRVLIETSDGVSSWVTVGVGHNVIEASWGALVDGLTFGLRRHGA